MSSPVIELIREKLNIVDVVNEYIPELRKAGRNYKANCPFHNEKTPSFTVNPEKGIFYCFGCNEGGDIFSFVMKIEGLTFHEAAKKLALKAGIDYGEDHYHPLTETEKEMLALKKIINYAKNFYHKQLFSPEGEQARLYIGKRKIDKATAEQFELGWAPHYGTVLADDLKNNSFSCDLAIKAGLLKENEDGKIRDAFRGRVIFPIKNQSGDTIAFGGRVLSQEYLPKYLNSQETPIFSKRKVLYGLNQALPSIRQSSRALLLEGYMDVISAYQHGINFAVAPLGTALTEEHAKILGRYAKNIIIMFDDDTAGIKASVRAAEIFLKAGIYVRIASLEDGLDPDEYLIQRGVAAFENLLSKSCDLLEFRIKNFFKNIPNPNSQEKAQAIGILLETVSQQQDEILKSEWIKTLANKFNVELDSILRQSEKSQPAIISAPKPHASGSLDDSMPPLERDLIQMLIQSPELISLANELTPDDFSDTLAKELFREIKSIPENKKKDISVILQEKFAKQATCLFAWAVTDISDNKIDANSAVSAVKTLKKFSLKRKLQDLKNLPNMTPEQLKQYGELTMLLKASDK